jgi:muramoyltetrapeptide carboxypeptidase
MLNMTKTSTATGRAPSAPKHAKSGAIAAKKTDLHAHIPHGHPDHVHDYHCRPDASGIYVISPSGAVADPETLARAQARLSGMGFKVALDRGVLNQEQRFAGTDTQRLAAFTRALKQKLPIVMASRGSYGVGRLLGAFDWQALANSGKRFVGHSDFTAFSLALYAKTEAISYAGPMACFDFGAKKPEILTAEIFGECMRGELEILSFETQDADAVDGRGILWGGNLAMITSLLGTPYMPKIKGGILFVEDVGEHPYRIERMLNQLAQAGILGKQKALLLGGFTDYRLAVHDRGYDLNAAIAFIRKSVKIPVITGLPFGHTAMKVTLPVGAKVGVATEKGLAHLVLDEHQH